MSLLELEHVSKCYGRGVNQHMALRDVSMTVEQGEMVAVWGMRRSGRSTLLRVAAGVETPDAGTVRFCEQDLAGRHGEILGAGIGFCRKTFRSGEGEVLRDHLVVGQVARGVSLARAAARAKAALKRVELSGCETARPTELDGAETVRAAIARALAFEPRLLLIDEPTIGVDLLARDGILLLLHSLARDGIGILASTGEAPGLSGARAMTLSEGELHGRQARELAKVVPLRRSA